MNNEIEQGVMFNDYLLLLPCEIEHDGSNSLILTNSKDTRCIAKVVNKQQHHSLEIGDIVLFDYRESLRIEFGGQEYYIAKDKDIVLKLNMEDESNG